MYRYRFYDLKVHFWWPNKHLFSYRQRWNTLYYLRLVLTLLIINGKTEEKIFLVSVFELCARNNVPLKVHQKGLFLISLDIDDLTIWSLSWMGNQKRKIFKVLSVCFFTQDVYTLILARRQFLFEKSRITKSRLKRQTSLNDYM